MLTTLLSIGAIAAIALTVLGVIFVVGMRTKSRIVQGTLIALARSVFNPQQLRKAGRPGSFASIVRHRGRRSGRPYETPVTVVRDGEAFLIALPYGPRTQWLRNVLAAGSAVLVTEGETVAVDRPLVVATQEVADRFSRTDQRTFRLMSTTECLRLQRAAVDAEGEAQPVAA